MRPRDVADLLALSALWGGSFLLMRITAPAFGPAAMVALRVGIAALVLAAMLAWTGKLGGLRRHAGVLVRIGVVNSALPFLLFGWALLTIPAGLASVLNATSPIFAALVARVWLGERLTASRWTGMVLGLIGVAVLLSDRVGLGVGGSVAALAVGACLLGSMLYGVAAALAKRSLGSTEPMVVAAGSQIGASMFAWPVALAAWPAVAPQAGAWWAAGMLGVACTGVAYVLYFRLVANTGPARAITVTFLVPAFGMVFGAALLGEQVGLRMITGCAVVLAGTALATGVLTLPVPAPRRA